MRRPSRIATPRKGLYAPERGPQPVECPKCGWEGEAYPQAQCPECDTYLRGKRT